MGPDGRKAHEVTMERRDWRSKIPLTFLGQGTCKAILLRAKVTEWWEKRERGSDKSLNWDLREDR